MVHADCNVAPFVNLPPVRNSTLPQLQHESFQKNRAPISAPKLMALFIWAPEKWTPQFMETAIHTDGIMESAPGCGSAEPTNPKKFLPRHPVLVGFFRPNKEYWAPDRGSRNGNMPGHRPCSTLLAETRGRCLVGAWAPARRFSVLSQTLKPTGTA